MAPKIAIVFYSTWGHIQTLAQAEAEGIRAAGGHADLFQLPETLSQEVLTKINAPPKDTFIPTLTSAAELEPYDGFLLGISTRFGTLPTQWKTFWDGTGAQWMSGAFWGKFAGTFVSSAGQGGGQEVTPLSVMSTLAHHGIIYVPLGTKPVGQLLSNIDEVRGGSAWGAGTFAGGMGQRQPTEIELTIAREQCKAFYKHLARIDFSKAL